MDSNGLRFELICLVGMGYEGRISSKFIFMYNGVLVITQGCIRTNLGCELRALDAMNNSRLWMT